MSFNLDTFIAEPQLDEFNGLKKVDLLQIRQHYKLAVNLSMGKGDIKKLILNYFVKERASQKKTWNVSLCPENRP